MPRQRAGGRLRRTIMVAAILLVGAVFVVHRLRLPGKDLTGLGRRLDNVVGSWAAESGLVHNAAASGREEMREGRKRWILLKRTFGVPRGRSLVRLKTELSRIASAHGLVLKTERFAGGRYTGSFRDSGGRPVMRVDLRARIRVAIVIDDIGYSLNMARRVCALPARVSVAVLPFTPRARQAASLAKASGKEVLLHLPMQPAYRLPDVPEYSVVLKPGMGLDEVRARVARAVGAVPGSVGVNNHEGSVATEDPELMGRLMAVLKERGLFFVDSATTAGTVAWPTAKSAGVKWGRRRVFLDAERSTAFTEEAFRKMTALARKDGEVIAIGHPIASTLSVLEKRIPRAEREGFEFVPVSEVLRAY